MKLALVIDHFSELTGYTENCLPRYLAKLGVDVHIVAPNVKPYFDSPWYAETYEKFYGPPVVEPGVSRGEGVTVHRLPHRMRGGYVESVGLISRIREIGPDIVQCMSFLSWNILRVAMARNHAGYRLFTGNHMAYSVFRPFVSPLPFHKRAWFFASRRLLGSFVAHYTEKCIAASDEAAEMSFKYYGIPKHKVVVLGLGVDTDRFHPVESAHDAAERKALRESISCAETDILCIYTGKFTEGKDPLILAKAIEILKSDGKPFLGLFIGNGPQKQAIESCRGCCIRDFLPWTDLPRHYRGADIAVWPKQESMSALDAAASGIPVVLSDRINVVERVEGNGRTYPQGSAEDLAGVLGELSETSVRQALGDEGVRKMRGQFSWEQNAEVRMRYYREALSGRSPLDG